MHTFWLLVKQFSKRMLLAEFKGSFLGVGWLVVRPLILLAVYVLVFHGIFNAKWPGVAHLSAWDYGLFIFVGLSAFQFFSDTLSRSTSLIFQQPNLVSKVVFPLAVLPTALTLSQFGIFSLNLGLLLVILASLGHLTVTLLWVPVIVLPLFLIVWGLALFLSALGVYIRDLAQLVGMMMTALMFLSPIFYASASIPKEWQFWFHLNPLTLVIENLRDVMLLNRPLDLESWGGLMLVSVILCVFGLWFFNRVKKGFADVL